MQNHLITRLLKELSLVKRARSLACQTAFVLAAGLTTSAVAQGDPSVICERAALVAAQQTSVPLDVLRAISLTETGRNQGGSTRPWPWTVNMQGKGVWFETEDDARAYVYEHFKLGARSFDVGCFQLNYKWHHRAFASIEEMFDPIAGALYAARFLTDLFQEKGNWLEAAGAYHSRTPEHADRYMASFADHRATVEATPAQSGQSETLMSMSDPKTTPVAAPPARERVNTFPLLQSGSGQGSVGSLVPLAGSDTSSRLIDFFGAG